MGQKSKRTSWEQRLSGLRKKQAELKKAVKAARELNNRLKGK